MKLAHRLPVPIALFLFKRLSSFSIKILGTYWKMNWGDTVSLIFGGLHQIKYLSKSEFLISVGATIVKKDQNVFKILTGSQTSFDSTWTNNEREVAFLHLTGMISLIIFQNRQVLLLFSAKRFSLHFVLLPVRSLYSYFVKFCKNSSLFSSLFCKLSSELDPCYSLADGS